MAIEKIKVDGVEHELIASQLTDKLQNTLNAAQNFLYEKLELYVAAEMQNMDIITTNDTTLVNSKEGGLKINYIAGASEQKQYTGKNLFNGNLDFNDYQNLGNGYHGAKIFVGQNAIVTASIRRKYEIGIKSGFLRLSADGTLSTDTANIWLYNNTASDACNESVTITSVDGYISIFFTSDAYDVFKNEIQIEIGAEKTKYEPYTGNKIAPSIEYPQSIKNVGDNNYLTVKTQGKNLFDCYTITAQDLKLAYDTLSNSYTKINSLKYNGEIQCTFTGVADALTAKEQGYTNGYFAIGLNGLEVGKTYTLIYDFEILNNPLNVDKHYCLINLANTFYTFDILNNRAKCTFTLQDHLQTAGKVAIEFRPCARDMIYKNFMILEGEHDFESYEPYNSNGASISFAKEELSGIENVVDIIDFNNNKYIQKIGKYIFTGEEELVDFIKDHNAITFKINHLDNSPILCSHAIQGKDSISWSNINYLLFNTIYWGVTSIDEMKALLTEKYTNGNPVTIYYILEEPIERDLSQKEQIALSSLSTYNNTTYITFLDNIQPSKIEAEYGKSKTTARLLKAENENKILSYYLNNHLVG